MGFRDDVGGGEEGLARQLRQRHRIRPRRPAEGREDDASAGAPKRGGERRIFPRLRRAREIDVEGDQGRLALPQPVDGGGVDASRPRPALEGGDASGVDLDDMDLAAGRAPAPGGALVLKRLVEAVARIRPQKQQAQGPGKHQRQQAPVL
jgi:hypothetical protein